MLSASYCPYVLDFKFTAHTSRESMRQRPTWLIRLADDASGRIAYGECALFPGLSAEPAEGFTKAVAEACSAPESAVNHPYSSIRFGFETAFKALEGIPDDSWHRGLSGIIINGLIWMGDKHTMAQRITEKLDGGFDVLKLKIGGINFEDELDLLRMIRREFSPDVLTIRLDANGSFSPQNAMERLKRLSEMSIHSIEQPIRAGQWDKLAAICAHSPIPIALDEELIGTTTAQHKAELLDIVRPQYIILKPALCGGFSGASEWIDQAQKRAIGFWLTSALESNVGLEAIASFASKLHNGMPQGLGTGQLYHNNFPSPLELRGQFLYYNPSLPPINLENLTWIS